MVSDSGAVSALIKILILIPTEWFPPIMNELEWEFILWIQK